MQLHTFIMHSNRCLIHISTSILTPCYYLINHASIFKVKTSSCFALTRASAKNSSFSVSYQDSPQHLKMYSVLCSKVFSRFVSQYHFPALISWPISQKTGYPALAWKVNMNVSYFSPSTVCYRHQQTCPKHCMHLNLKMLPE